MDQNIKKDVIPNSVIYEPEIDSYVEQDDKENTEESKETDTNNN